MGKRILFFGRAVLKEPGGALDGRHGRGAWRRGTSAGGVAAVPVRGGGQVTRRAWRLRLSVQPRYQAQLQWQPALQTQWRAEGVFRRFFWTRTLRKVFRDVVKMRIPYDPDVVDGMVLSRRETGWRRTSSR